jgi:GNAT superfamily N-acetyltransferase
MSDPPARIAIIEPSRVMSDAIEKLVSPRSRERMFNDRWDSIAIVAVARIGDRIVGIATMAPQHPGQSRPEVIGLWVTPAFRRRGIATTLLVALASESIARFKVAGFVAPITDAGVRAVEAAKTDGAELALLKKYVEPGLVLD